MLTVISTDLNTSLLLCLFCLLLETKQESSFQQVGGLEKKYFYFLFIASRSLLQSTRIQ